MGTLVEDPLFQLNLVLLLTLPNAPEGRVNPVFYSAGYRIHRISPRLGLPVTTLNALRHLKDDGSQTESVVILTCREAKPFVKPEVVLRRQGAFDFLVIECKVSSFSSTSSTARQAVTLLLLRDNTLRDALGGGRHENWTSTLAYVVKAGDEELMHVCLEELTDALRQMACAGSPHGVFGLLRQDDGIYLTTAHAPLSTLKAGGASKVRVLAADYDDYRPLYIIPFDLDVSRPDEYTAESSRCGGCFHFQNVWAFTLEHRGSIHDAVEQLRQTSGCGSSTVEHWHVRRSGPV